MVDAGIANSLCITISAILKESIQGLWNLDEVEGGEKAAGTDCNADGEANAPRKPKTTGLCQTP